MFNYRLYLVMATMMVLLSGCGMNKVRISGVAEGQKELYVVLANDPLLISIEVKTILENNGYKIDLSTESPEMSQSVVESNVLTTYKSVSQSTYRYELQIGYSTWFGVNSDKVAMIAASLRDRKNSKILGTWRWKWDQFVSPPTPEKAVEMIEKNLLRPIFEKVGEGPR